MLDLVAARSKAVDKVKVECMQIRLVADPASVRLWANLEVRSNFVRRRSPPAKILTVRTDIKFTHTR
jgi:hypothetical protein